jgi:hypothetical protein
VELASGVRGTFSRLIYDGFRQPECLYDLVVELIDTSRTTEFAQGDQRSGRHRVGGSDDRVEVDVLKGLTRPLRALSFEYLPPAHDAAIEALDIVDRLGASAGGYRYNYSPVETMRWASEHWLAAADLVRLLDRYRPLGRSGDIYARLTEAVQAPTSRTGAG